MHIRTPPVVLYSYVLGSGRVEKEIGKQAWITWWFYGFEYVDDTLDMRIKCKEVSLPLIQMTGFVQAPFSCMHIPTSLKKDLQFSFGILCLIFLSTVIACGYVLERLADTSMLGIECSSDKRIIGEIVDLTLSTNQIHSIHFVFLTWSSATNSRASPLTLRSAKAHSTSFRQKDDLLFSYPRFSLITTSTNFYHVDTNIQVHHLIHI